VTVHAWRIVKARHAAGAFTGEGARRYGGRWNSKGTAVVYTAGSPSLAILEMLAHLDAHEILAGYLLAEVTFDESLVQEIDLARLPANWRSDPPPLELRALGDHWWAARASAALRVPSALVDMESNYLLNPAHPQFPAIAKRAFRPFRFDPRLLKTR
jgi:RES domain-containing protein